jgi:hypothetical protein
VMLAACDGNALRGGDSMAGAQLNNEDCMMTSLDVFFVWILG